MNLIIGSSNAFSYQVLDSNISKTFKRSQHKNQKENASSSYSLIYPCNQSMWYLQQQGLTIKL